MKLTYIRCAICEEWMRAHTHCHNCGAFHIVLERAKTLWFNYKGIEMVRGLPTGVQKLIQRAIF